MAYEWAISAYNKICHIHERYINSIETNFHLSICLLLVDLYVNYFIKKVT